MMSFVTIERRMEQLAGGLAVLGGLGLLFATAMTCASILLKLLRRGLDWLFPPVDAVLVLEAVRPILGEEELVTYGVGVALFAALPWCMIRRGHIKVDLLEPLFGGRFNRALDLLGDLALAVIAYLILTRQWFLIFKKARRSEESFFGALFSGDVSVVGDRLRDGQESQILGLPLWPTYMVAELCVAVFFMVACFCVLRSARALWRGGA
ncbi:TRAP transporter small permease subunit [Alphaproteobacteria bacterium KMM 3653]|uniref:TRAP transporter small permease protein n=1 Tax=Harenicola maris TaxID=2841044 RepID=A0AAP2CNM3_9RHOB|nr:TRAP transporter small permease subunit [Harenicola maris]